MKLLATVVVSVVSVVDGGVVVGVVVSVVAPGVVITYPNIVAMHNNYLGLGL